MKRLKKLLESLGVWADGIHKALLQQNRVKSLQKIDSCWKRWEVSRSSVKESVILRPSSLMKSIAELSM